MAPQLLSRCGRTSVGDGDLAPPSFSTTEILSSPNQILQNPFLHPASTPDSILLPLDPGSRGSFFAIEASSSIGGSPAVRSPVDSAEFVIPQRAGARLWRAHRWRKGRPTTEVCTPPPPPIPQCQILYFCGSGSRR
jgi:hypothetical protein